MNTYTYTEHESILHIENVSLTLGGRRILRDVSATVNNIERPDCVQGQVICILGPSGIGKTQLARIVCGLQTPDAGRVLVEGRPTRKGLVGMVPQTYPLFEFTTVAHNLEIAGRFGHLSPDEATARSAEFVTDFGLEAYVNNYPSELSGGTRQRVAIVRQLMSSRHFLVMDEPFSGLDPAKKLAACGVITKIANRDTLNTVLINTHDVAEGMAIADTVWILGREPGLPGARIIQTYDLAALDLCWHPEIATDARFQSLVVDVKRRLQSAE